MTRTHNLPTSPYSHPEDPIPLEPRRSRRLSINQQPVRAFSPRSSADSYSNIDEESPKTSPSTSATESSSEDSADENKPTRPSLRQNRASTVLISENSDDVRRILGKSAAGDLLQRVCCGGGCCMLKDLEALEQSGFRAPIATPTNAAYDSLGVKLGFLSLESQLSGLADLPKKTVSFESIESKQTPEEREESKSKALKHPPNFVTPHPPYEVYSAPIHHARELTKAGAEKRTYHFDIDVTDYPEESGDVDFVVGGAIGVCAPNATEKVDLIFDLLGVPSFVRDKPVLMKTTTGRWPTIWGEEEARELVTTRRELLTWCSDIQSYAPTKQLFRLFAEYAIDDNEKKILLYLSSAQGQAAFCDIRTGPHISLIQLLSAFPSSRPPLDHLLSALNTLMPRFYSLSQDPQVSCERGNQNCKKLIEIAVTVHEGVDWKTGSRTGTGSGFLERIAQQMIQAEKDGINPRDLDIRIPMFRGLMANPLAREFVSDGPMLLIGAGVGIAPFRGFVHRRLKSANCANKVWVIQGVRDSLLDELYSGDWGVHEEKVKKVVQSRRGRGRYVQEEVRAQADLVWFIINALDGRIFVCGSTVGMGEGVEAALVDVAQGKGGLNEEEAKSFWAEKKKAGQYIAETW